MNHPPHLVVFAVLAIASNASALFARRVRILVSTRWATTRGVPRC